MATMVVENIYNKAVEYLTKGEDIQAYELFENLAKEKDVDAQIKLGYMLFLGSKNIEKNIDGAIYWFQIAEKESSEAQRMLGFCYLEKGNVEKGISFLQKSVDRKNSIAIVDLGDIYDFGKYGITKDKDKALDYYTKGCEEKNYEGCRNLISLLVELKKDKFEYIKNNIGILKFIFIFLKNSKLRIQTPFFSHIEHHNVSE